MLAEVGKDDETCNTGSGARQKVSAAAAARARAKGDVHCCSRWALVGDGMVRALKADLVVLSRYPIAYGR